MKCVGAECLVMVDDRVYDVLADRSAYNYYILSFSNAKVDHLPKNAVLFRLLITFNRRGFGDIWQICDVDPSLEVSGLLNAQNPLHTFPGNLSSQLVTDLLRTC